MIGESILETGYCVHFDHTSLEMFPEQGPMWQWVRDNREEVLAKVGANYRKPGPGAIREVEKQDLDELKKIFEVTGGMDWFNRIEEHSARKADEMHMDIGTDKESTYFRDVYTTNNQEKHTRS